MKASKRVLAYAKENFTGVMHTTLNPEGPGVVRIHLIPPKFNEEEVGASVVILNGQDILPVNTAWSILLSEFIKQVNEYHEMAITPEDVKLIVDNTIKGVRKVFPLLPKSVIRNDLWRITNTFEQVAFGKEVDEEIHYMNLGDYAEYMQAPHRMDLMVSAMTKDGKWHCNQNCIHCYAAGQEHSSEEELSTDEWKKILEKCKAAMIPQVTFTGGEPTMRDDLFELIDSAKWFVTRLNTNGIKLTKEYCHELKEASLDSCQITFYSCDEEIHDRLVGAKQYQNTLAGIDNAIETGLNISINTPLCSLNKDYVKTLKFLRQRGVIYVTCSGLITTGNATTANSEALQLSTDELKDVLQAAVKFCFENGMEISFTSPGWIEESFIENLGINKPTCGACLSNMAVTPSGNVVPCQSFLTGEALGNMLKDSWEDIWNNPLCVERRKFSAKMTGECPLRKKADAVKEAGNE